MPLRSLFSFIVLSGLIGSVVFIACDGDEAKKQVSVAGRWELRKALRNQKETGNLDGTYFLFGDNGMMETNVTGTEESAEYTVHKNEIVQKGNPQTKFVVQASDDSTMTLVTTMRGIEFELQLARAPEPAPVEELPDSTQLLPDGEAPGDDQ